LEGARKKPAEQQAGPLEGKLGGGEALHGGSDLQCK